MVVLSLNSGAVTCKVAPTYATSCKNTGQTEMFRMRMHLSLFSFLSSIHAPNHFTIMENAILHPFVFLYQLLQWFLDKFLSPKPLQPGDKLGRPKIAIIGAGLTGVSAASHCVGHGFDVQIFEAGPRKQLGGIWSVSRHVSWRR